MKKVVLCGAAAAGAYLLLCFGGQPSVQDDGPPKVVVHVQIDGDYIPVQVTPQSTIESVVCLAMSKTNISRRDLCVVYGDRSLDWDKSIVAENIECYSTIKVIRRMRDDYHRVPSQGDLPYVTLDEHIKSSRGEFVEERIVHPDLIGSSTEIKEGRTVKGQEYILSELGRRTFKNLVEMVYKIHNLDHYCLDGSFKYEDIRYMRETDGYFIDPEHLRISKSNKFTPDGYEKDIRALGQVLQRVCDLKFNKSSSGDQVILYPAYVAHLLRIMKSMPKGAKNSDTFKEFLRKHPCMLSPVDRQGLILQVHTQLKFHPKALRKKMALGLGRYNDWIIIANKVPAFVAVHNYRQYSEDKMAWFNFWRNFLSHPTENECPDFTIEDADLALLCHFDERLAEFLCLLACGGVFTSNIHLAALHLKKMSVGQQSRKKKPTWRQE